MFWFLYGLGVRTYYLLIWLISPFNAKASKFVTGRKQTFPNRPIGKKIWIHVSSLGEFEQARPIIDSLKSSKGVDITLTFFSPSGFEVRQNYEKVDRVLYMPLDTRKNAKSFINHFKFDLALFIKYDFWMNHLRVCIDNDIPVVFASVILRSKQFYFKSGRHFYLPIFSKIQHFFVQDADTYDLLRSFKISQVTACGDTRMDRVQAIADQAIPIKVIETLSDSRRIFVIGSAWPSDMEFLSEFFQKFGDRFLFMIAPHDISEGSIEKIEKGLINVQRFSKYIPDQPLDFLIIDNMGMLSSLYGYADFAYVGGALRGALHNIAEAAAHGKPVFFAKHVNNQKFREVEGLTHVGAAFEYDDINEVIVQTEKLLMNMDDYTEVCNAAKQYIASQSGATKLIVDHIRDLLS